MLKEWMKYVLAPNRSYDLPSWKVWLCRLRGHPCGPKYYTSALEAIEPDWHCKNCNDDIG